MNSILTIVKNEANFKEGKSDPQLKDIPFFIFTNYSALGLEEKRKDFGAEKHIIKSDITSLQLVEFIKNLFRRK